MLDRLRVVTTTRVTYPINFRTLPMTTIHMGFYKIYQPFSFGWDFDGKCIGKSTSHLDTLGYPILWTTTTTQTIQTTSSTKTIPKSGGLTTILPSALTKSAWINTERTGFFLWNSDPPKIDPLFLVRDEESLPEKHVLKLSCSWCP